MVQPPVFADAYVLKDHDTPLVVPDMSDFPTEPLDWQTVAAARRACRVGAAVVYEPSMGSTNERARSLLRHGGADGTVVVTDDQTSGRGRLGRTWTVAPRSALTVSIALRLPASFPLQIMTPAAALAVDTIVSAEVGPRCAIKWPNDVLIDGLKVAGILVELDEAAGWHAVVGIGLNVNATPPYPHATSLAAATGRRFERHVLLIALLDAFEETLVGAERDPAQALRRWRSRLCTLGRRVRAHTPAGTIEGVAIDVDENGALLLRYDDGTVRPLLAGEVSLAPDPAGPP